MSTTRYFLTDAGSEYGEFSYIAFAMSDADVAMAREVQAMVSRFEEQQKSAGRFVWSDMTVRGSVAGLAIADAGEVEIPEEKKFVEITGEQFDLFNNDESNRSLECAGLEVHKESVHVVGYPKHGDEGMSGRGDFLPVIMEWAI